MAQTISARSAEFASSRDILERSFGRFNESKHRRDKDGKFTSGGAARAVGRSLRGSNPRAKNLGGSFGKGAGFAAGGEVGTRAGFALGAKLGHPGSGRGVAGAVAGTLLGGVAGARLGRSAGRRIGDAVGGKMGMKGGTTGQRVAAGAAGYLTGLAGSRAAMKHGGRAAMRAKTAIKMKARDFQANHSGATGALRSRLAKAGGKKPHLAGGKLGKPGTTGTAFVGTGGKLKGKMGPGFKMTPKTLAKSKTRLKVQKLIGKWKH